MKSSYCPPLLVLVSSEGGVKYCNSRRWIARCCYSRGFVKCVWFWLILVIIPTGYNRGGYNQNRWGNNYREGGSGGRGNYNRNQQSGGGYNHNRTVPYNKGSTGSSGGYSQSQVIHLYRFIVNPYILDGYQLPRGKICYSLFPLIATVLQSRLQPRQLQPRRLQPRL